MAIPEPDLTFVELSNETDVINFLLWLDKQSNYPINFYLAGCTYSLKDDMWKTLFQLGFDAARDVFKDMHKC